MAYEGWMSLAGTEIINNERCRTYVANGLPALRMPLDGCNGETPDALHRMLDDDEYRTPAIDDAPWIDPDDPDTADFYGVFGLSAEGLTDSTRTGNVVENTGDGGGITGQRKGTRSVRVSALLIGATTAAVEAGQAWLSSALDGDCDADCNGSDLCFLQAITDPEDWGDYVTDPIARSAMKYTKKGTYNLSTGRFTPLSTTEELHTPPFPPPLPCDEIIWQFHLQGVPGTQVNLRSYYEGGLAFSDVVTIDSDGDGTYSISDRGLGKTLAYASLRVVVGTYVDLVAQNVSYRDGGVNAACFNHYMRQIRQVSPIAGPTTVEDYALSAGAMRKVEFTLTSVRPWIFGSAVPVINYQSVNLLKAGADQTKSFFKLPKTMPVPDAPAKPTLVRDPACPVIPAPPRAKADFSTCGPTPSYHVSYGVSLPGSAIPLWHDAVPSVSLFAGEQAARAVRVRFFPRPLGTLQDVSDLDYHSACGSFIVDYIPANGWFKLDGQNQRAYARLPGKVADDSADHLLSGMTDAELFQWPVLTCGTDYVMVVDVDGENQSLVSMSVSLAPRY